MQIHFTGSPGSQTGDPGLYGKNGSAAIVNHISTITAVMLNSLCAELMVCDKVDGAMMLKNLYGFGLSGLFKKVFFNFSASEIMGMNYSVY
jgi:high-affinity nickel permease